MSEYLDIDRTALVVIDMQNDFCHEDGIFARRGSDVSPMPDVAAANKSLIAHFHRAGRPVFFTRMEHGPWSNTPTWKRRLDAIEEAAGGTGVCDEGTWGVEFYGVAPTDEDRVMVKHRYSAFLGTPLDTYLRAAGCDGVYLSGVVTNVCVESTARDAFMRDLRTVVVEDACAGPTRDEHDAAIHNIRTYFGAVIRTEDLPG